MNHQQTLLNAVMCWIPWSSHAGLHPGQKNSLDALCKRYNVDNSARQFHGALLDAQILADVYLAMTGGQAALLLDATTEMPAQHAKPSVNRYNVMD